MPKHLKPSERKAIAKEIIDFIVDRTQRGFDKDGKKFQGYSSGYKKSLDFKLAGKGSTVDLTMTEEMLGELDLLTERSGSVTIGYDPNDEKLNGKVEGNRKGTYGNKKPVTRPRDFLGISKTALNNILKSYAPKKKELQTELVNRSTEKARELLIDTRRNDTEGE